MPNEYGAMFFVVVTTVNILIAFGWLGSLERKIKKLEAALRKAESHG